MTEPTREEWFLCALRNTLPPECCKGTMAALEKLIEKQKEFEQAKAA